MLQALGLGPNEWGSGKASQLDLALRNLDPSQARAVLLLLIDLSSGFLCGYLDCSKS